jgi:hypothetical protein
VVAHRQPHSRALAAGGYLGPAGQSHQVLLVPRKFGRKKKQNKQGHGTERKKVIVSKTCYPKIWHLGILKILS